MNCKRIFHLAALHAALAAALAAGCSGPRTTPNLVVVLVDTLRADHLSLYGYRRTTTPELDRWAATEGVVFENVRAQSPCTFPSVNSLLTSRSPAHFFANGSEVGFGIPETMPSLAVRLSRVGYRAAAVSASPIVRATPSPENAKAGFGAGFERFDEFCYWREAGCVSTRANDALRLLEPPFLLYLHYLDPHDPYELPGHVTLERPFADAGPPGEAKQFVRSGDPRPVAEFLYGGGPDPGLGDDDLAHWIDLYDDEIQYWDREFARFAQKLRRQYPDTVFAVVSDHGEEFLEHGHVKHCRSLYDTELRVPMVLFAPGLAPARVATPVSNLDLLPTLLDLLGVPFPPGELEGASLRPRLGAPASAASPRLQLAMNAYFWGASDGRFKLIQDPTNGREELYDLLADPLERRPLPLGEKAALAEMRRALAELRAIHYRAEEGANEAAKKLRSVGYLQ